MSDRPSNIERGELVAELTRLSSEDVAMALDEPDRRVAVHTDKGVTWVVSPAYRAMRSRRRRIEAIRRALYGIDARRAS